MVGFFGFEWGWDFRMVIFDVFGCKCFGGEKKKNFGGDINNSVNNLFNNFSVKFLPSSSSKKVITSTISLQFSPRFISN